jgi:hypothetical protein
MKVLVRTGEVRVPSLPCGSPLDCCIKQLDNGADCLNQCRGCPRLPKAAENSLPSLPREPYPFACVTD